MSEMKRIYRKEGKGTHVDDPESSYIDLFEEDGERGWLSWSDAWNDLRAEHLEYGDRFDLENPHYNWPCHDKSYKERMGKDFPQLYKIKVTVEVEALSDEETRRLWEARIQRLNRSGG